MKCPKCKSAKLDIQDSRKRCDRVWRRRRCMECSYKFSTTEYVGEPVSFYKDREAKLRALIETFNHPQEDE